MKNTAQTTEKAPANRKYKDTVFRMLFKNREELLSLFNAVNGTNYTEPEELEITTLENAIYNSLFSITALLSSRSAGLSACPTAMRKTVGKLTLS